MNHEHIPPKDEHQRERGQGGDAPVLVGRPAATGGRRVTIHGRSAGIAHSDADVVEFLRRAGLPDAWELLDDPGWVGWQGGRPRTYDTTPPGHGDHGEVIG